MMNNLIKPTKCNFIGTLERKNEVLTVLMVAKLTSSFSMG